MRLTADILLRAESYLNACRERELNLRGLKIPAIENISVLQDQFDVLDFSDNEIRKLDSFPQMKRLHMIMACNNYISKIGRLGDSLKGLTALVLTNNKVQDLSEIDNIATLNKLEHLSLLDNPVMLKPHYRNYVIFRIPTLKSLDFIKIQKKERDGAMKYFKSAAGKALLSSLDQSTSSSSSSSSSSQQYNSSSSVMDDEGNTIETSESAEMNIAESSATATVKPSAPAPVAVVLTEEQKKLVREAIQNATSKEQIDLIEKQLKSGTFFDVHQHAKGDGIQV